jgi:hypothetical protein
MPNEFCVAPWMYSEINSQLDEIKGKLEFAAKNKDFCPYNPELVSTDLKKILDTHFNYVNRNGILQLVATKKPLMIDAVDGTQMIKDAKEEIFKLGIDEGFKRYADSNKYSRATPVTTVQNYRLISGANFLQIFKSLSINLDMLCLNQHQIINFCSKYFNKLCQSKYGTFFLFKGNYELLVARLGTLAGDLGIRLYKLNNYSIWFARDYRQIIVPQLVS